MSKRVPLRVPEATVEDWDDHVETHTGDNTDVPKYDNRSQFIKYAANQQLKRDTGVAGDTNARGESGGANAAQIDRLVETVERMADRIETLEDRIEDATRTMQTGSAISEETTTDVWAALPTAPERATTAEGIAEGLGLDSDTVRVALESLHENQPETVRKREIESIDTDDDTVRITTHTGQTVRVEDANRAVKRRNPLWWRRE